MESSVGAIGSVVRERLTERSRKKVSHSSPKIVGNEPQSSVFFYILAFNLGDLSFLGLESIPLPHLKSRCNQDTGI